MVFVYALNKKYFLKMALTYLSTNRRLLMTVRFLFQKRALNLSLFSVFLYA